LAIFATVICFYKIPPFASFRGWYHPQSNTSQPRMVVKSTGPYTPLVSCFLGNLFCKEAGSET